MNVLNAWVSETDEVKNLSKSIGYRAGLFFTLWFVDILSKITLYFVDTLGKLTLYFINILY